MISCMGLQRISLGTKACVCGGGVQGLVYRLHSGDDVGLLSKKNNNISC